MPSNKPKIYVRDGKAHEAADQALEVLYEADLPIFQLGGKLVRICHIDGGAYDDNHKSTFGVDHDGNKVRFPTVLDLTPVYLSRILGQRIEWSTLGEKNKTIIIDPPNRVVNQILGMIGEWKFPEFSGISSIPFLLADGRLIKLMVEMYTRTYM